jgi:hypothetical protein
MALETLFWSLAIVGTAVFILRATLSVFGIGLGHEGDALHPVDAAGTEGTLQIFSFTSLSAFTTVFGWAGLAALKEFGFTPVVAILCAGLAGLAVMLAVASLFRALFKLEAKGQVYDIHETVGKTGTTYEKIPAGGTGIVQISFSTLDRETLVVRKL